MEQSLSPSTDGKAHIDMKHDRCKVTHLSLPAILSTLHGARPDTNVVQVLFQRVGDSDYAVLFNSEERASRPSVGC